MRTPDLLWIKKKKKKKEKEEKEKRMDTYSCIRLGHCQIEYIAIVRC